MNATAWVPIMVLALAAPVACQEKATHKPMPGKARVMTDTEVTLTYADAGHTITAVPPTALVAIRDALKFTVSGLPEGAELEVDFVSAPAEAGKDKGKSYVGPFPPRAGDVKNPERGRYSLGPGQSYLTEPADEIGYWKYQVIVRLKGGEEYSIDPGVIIKEGI